MKVPSSFLSNFKGSPFYPSLPPFPTQDQIIGQSPHSDRLRWKNVAKMGINTAKIWTEG